MGDKQISEPARRQAAAYARQPSLWPAPRTTSPRANRIRRACRLVRTGLTTGVLLAGPPWLLWQGFGNPITVLSSWWTTGPFTTDSTAAPGAGLRVALIWAGWLGWAVLATLLCGSLAGVLRGRRLPRWRLPMPVHRLLFGITGTATVALATTASATAAMATPAAHATTAAQQAPATTLGPVDRDVTRHDVDAAEPRRVVDSGLITVAVADTRYEHRVRVGDTLSKVAKRWLGDADRWPDICRLNKHRHFEAGGTLTDCDLIYPGWELRLPADAVPPTDAKPTPPARTTTEPRPAPERPDPRPDPSAAETSTPADSTQTVEPTTPSTTEDTAEDTDDAAPGRTGEDLVLPGGSVIPWALPAAISAAAALVWLQRRRRYVPGTGHDDLIDLPAPVRAAQHHTHHTPIPAEPAATGQQLPAGGIGLIGSGADAAARGLIIAALTTGTPADPDQHAEVIIDRDTLTDLIGDTPITAWPRLHITDTLDHALTLLDTHLLHRARILDEHSLTDLGALRDTAPAEEALPPLLLITRTDLATPSTRARITFALTHGLDVTVVVLGHWPHGVTLSVTDDGDTAGTAAVGRLAVLDAATTQDLLTTVREAHTGEPGQPTAPATPPEQKPAEPPKTEDHATHDRATHDRVRLRVLGTPRIEDIVLPGRDLRGRAAELAVFLACHPDGADTETIAEHLVPDVRRRQAKQLVHTNASNLRHVLGRAGGPITAGYVIKRGVSARYRLDPTTVAVDLWQLRDLLTRAQLASAPARAELLREACDLHTAPLADGCDYEWVEPHREKARRWGTEAHLLLADDLIESDPQAASDLLDKAIGLDRYNEELYRKAMHARHAIGDADGIRALLRALTKTLADLDAEPAEITVDLAATLRTSLDQQ